MHHPLIARILAGLITLIWLLLLSPHFLETRSPDFLRYHVLLEKYALFARGLIESESAPSLGKSLDRAIQDAPLSLADEIIALFPEHPIFFMERGILRAHRGDTDGAVLDLAMARVESKGSAAMLPEALEALFSGSPLPSYDCVLLIESSGLSPFFRSVALVRYCEKMGEASEARRYGADLSTRARITARSVLIGATVFASLVLFGLTILVVYVIRLIRRPPESRAPIDGLLLLPVWIVFIGWQFIESGVHILLLELVGIDSLRSPSGILLLKALSSGAGCALLFGVVLTASGFAARDLGISFKVSLLSRFAAGLAGFLVAVPTVFSVSLLSQYLLKNPGISSNPIFDLLLQGSPPAGTIYIILAVCLVAPFFEEVMFRAFLYSALKSRWGTGKATAASAFLFALVHGETAILLPVFTLGLILAWLYERSGSLWPSVVCHALWNSTTIAFTLLILAP